MVDISGVNGNRLVYDIKNGDNLTSIAKKYDTDINTILKLNPQIVDANLIYAGKKLILENNKIFTAREDFSPNDMNLGTVKIGDEEILEIGGKPIKSNFFANNLGALAQASMNDDNSATKIVIELQAGKSMTRKDNDTPYSILNKVLGDHLDMNSNIVQDKNGHYTIENMRLENTQLYNAFISEDVNGDNFTGENNKLLPRGNRGNNIQIPAVEVDKNGVKYFTLHGKDGALYFDAKGNKVEYQDGVILGPDILKQNSVPTVIKDAKAQEQPINEEFLLRNDNSDKFLNVGKIFINGKGKDLPQNFKSNFYQNNPNEIMANTMNDGTTASRLDFQLNLGSNISKRDISAQDILKKIIGNNFEKSSQVKKTENGTYKTEIFNLQNTELYNSFVSEAVNGKNFANGEIVRNEIGYNTVQLPALEIDANGVKYYTLHTNDGKVLYFDDKGARIS